MGHGSSVGRACDLNQEVVGSNHTAAISNLGDFCSFLMPVSFGGDAIGPF